MMTLLSVDATVSTYFPRRVPMTRVEPSERRVNASRMEKRATGWIWADVVRVDVGEES